MNVRVSLDVKGYKRKPQEEIKRINNRVVKRVVEMDLEELADKVGNQGCSFTPGVFSGGKRRTENFIETQLFGLDFDNGTSFQEIEEIANEYMLPVAFAYHTFSSEIEAPRFRVIMVHECRVTDVRIVKLIMAMLHQIFPDADKNCKDAARLFFGGKGLIGEVKEQTFNLCQLAESYQRFTFERQPKHYSRTMERFAKAQDIRCINNILQIHEVHSDGTSCEMGDKTGNDLYNNGSTLVFPPEKPQFAVIFGYQAHERIVHEEERPVSLYSKDVLGKKCRLWNDFEHRKHIHHDERFRLLTNVIHIEGGTKQFLKIIRRKHYDLRKWQFYASYVKVKGYHPQTCSGCPYETICAHKSNLLLTVREKDKITKLEEETYCSLEEVYMHIEKCMKDAMDSACSGISIIPAQTAGGKTEAFCRLIKDCENQCFLIATPTNRLKWEIYQRLQEKHVDAEVIWSLEELELPGDLKAQITALYDRGLGQNVRKLLKKFIEQNEEDDTFIIRQAIEQCRRFLTQNRYFSESRVVVTTHARLAVLSQEEIKRFTVICDEDILSTFLKNMRMVSMESVQRILKSGICPEILRSRLETVAGLENGEYCRLRGACGMAGISEAEMERLGITDNVNELTMASVCFRDDETLHYYCPQSLPEGKYIVLSATADSGLYRKYFPGWYIKEYPYLRARYQGKLLQYTFYSMSRQCIQNHKEKLTAYLAQYKNEYEMITFMKYEEELGACGLHFGNAEGVNELSGKNVLVLGTPHVNEFIYKMIGMHLGMKVDNEVLAVRKVQYKNYEFCIMTYKNEELRQLQFYYLGKELEQCIGRARLLRHDCTVLVFSNFPVEQAELVQEDYLSVLDDEPDDM